MNGVLYFKMAAHRRWNISEVTMKANPSIKNKHKRKDFQHRTILC
jgi:hypothetical protein